MFIIFLHATSWPLSDSMGPIIYHFCFTQYMLNMGHKVIQKVEKKTRLKFSILNKLFFQLHYGWKLQEPRLLVNFQKISVEQWLELEVGLQFLINT